MRRRPKFTRAVNAKLTQEDYERAVLAAGDATVTEWARGVILRELNGPALFERAIMEAVQSLRFVLFNGLPALAPTDAKSEAVKEKFRQLIIEAEERVPDKAAEVLGRRHADMLRRRQPVGGQHEA